jgi:multidrug resistance efflux pump
MKTLKIIMIMVLLLVLAAGGAGLAWYVYDSLTFFTTENAQITADMLSITPEITGKLKSWDVQEGDAVTVGQILGKQDVGMLVSNTAMNVQNLANSADSILSKTEIKSPITGKVIQSSVIKGQVISPGMEIAIIADTTHFYIKAHVEETAIFKIRPGQRVDIKIDAYPQRRFTGTVESIGQATDSAFSTMPSLNTSGTFSKVTQLVPVKINIVDPGDLLLMPGMNTKIKIHLKS